MGLGTFRVGGVTLPEGGWFMLGGNPFVITYAGGSDHNDVVLTVNSTPIANDDNVTTDEDHPLTFSVLVDHGHGADSDAEDNIVPAKQST